MTKRDTQTEIDSTFSESYKHPKWQQKRLQVFEADNYTCRRCGAKESQLHAHHMQYIKGRKPWEYPDANFVTLCDDCHAEFHRIKDGIYGQLNHFFEAWICGIDRAEFDADALYRMMVCIGCMSKDVSSASAALILNLLAVLEASCVEGSVVE